MGRCREHPPVRRCKCQHEFSGKASF
jgi:hypothetical protein